MKDSESIRGQLIEAPLENEAFRPLSDDVPLSSNQNDSKDHSSRKDEVRGLWGSSLTSTASVDTTNVIGALSASMSKLMPGKKDVAERYKKLRTRPPVGLFEKWDFYYSAGEPGLVGKAQALGVAA